MDATTEPAGRTAAHEGGDSRTARRAGLASFIGTTIEWYDFYIYSTASALVLGKLFFPATSSGTGTLASFGTLWLGFLARPLGGIVFGHLGDRIGRKKTLVTTLLMMGVATTLIGLLPTYSSAGLLAPVLLIVLRMVQGVAVGGEWGGAVLIASEHAPRGRGLSFGAFAQQGSPAGSILATLSFALLSQLPDASFDAWGWRLPFVSSAVLVVVGLVIRLRVAESPEFTRLRAEREVARVPLGEVLRRHPGTLVLGVLASSIGIAATYFITTFILSWATGDLGLDRSTMLNVLLCYSVAQFLVQPLGVVLAERFGTARTVGVLLTLNFLLVPVMYALVATGDAVAAGFGISLVGVTGAMNYAILAGLLAQAFPARVRYTGISLSYQLCSALIGGTAPLVGEWLFTAGGGSIVPVAVYQMVLVVVSLVCSLVVLARSARRHEE
ncbi:MFS transporter [Streptomyces sp. Ru73]|uniref:MFS transporter n=1 Tax=Streptomyces sp. Ru73 TaxID=2080748 RepID=UPI000CDE2A22|nr:MFS transporter [Streptomyces sp. Ru73]POX43526.1 MFS transporter [Streptomyces sp. Ru73]